MGRLSGETGRQGKATLLQGGVGECERKCSGSRRSGDPALEVVAARDSEAVAIALDRHAQGSIQSLPVRVARDLEAIAIVANG